MVQPRKVKILDTSYNEETNLVKWHVQFLDNPIFEGRDAVTLAWLSEDLGKALGIKGVIPPHLMQHFCKIMKGKELNLVIEAEQSNIETGDIGKEGIEDIQRRHDIMDKYPYYEVIKEIEDGHKQN